MAGSKPVWLIVGLSLGLVALGSWIGFRWLQRAFTGVLAEVASTMKKERVWGGR